MIKKTVLLFFINLLVPMVLFAQNKPPERTFRWECEYIDFSSKTGLNKEDPPLRFSLMVDAAAKKAYMLGEHGTGDVAYIMGRNRETFLEDTESGNINLTVIADDGQSVHSRHPIIGGQFLASQYYGRCTKR